MKTEGLRNIFSTGREKFAVAAIRLSIGWIFLTSGLAKLVENGLSYGKASGYLSSAVPVTTPEIAFSFPDIIGLPGLLLVKAGTLVVEPLMQLLAMGPFIGTLVVVSELFIGLSLIFGLLTRMGSALGAFMMLLFYYGNASWSHGLLNADLLYMLLFISLIALEAQKKLALDAWISEKYKIENKGVRKLLGV